jgi:hypothetical protein
MAGHMFVNPDVMSQIYEFAADCRPLALVSTAWYDAYLDTPDAAYWLGGRRPEMVLPKMMGGAWLESAADLIVCGSIPALEAAIAIIPAELLDDVAAALLNIAVTNVDARAAEVLHSFGYCKSHSEYIFVSKQVRDWYDCNCKCMHGPVDYVGFSGMEFSMSRMRNGKFPVWWRVRPPPIGMPPGPRGEFRRMIRFGSIDEIMDYVDKNPGMIDIGALVAAAETGYGIFRPLFERAAVAPTGLVKIAAENHVSRRWDAGGDVETLKLYHAHGFKVRLDQLSPKILNYADVDWLLEHYREAVELAAAEPASFTCELYHKLADAGIKLTPTEHTLRMSATRGEIEMQLTLCPALLREVADHRGLLGCMWPVVWCGTRAATTAYLTRLGFDPAAIEFCAWTMRTPM